MGELVFMLESRLGKDDSKLTFGISPLYFVFM